MAVAGKELHTAEVAYAAIEQVDKLLYMCHIKELPTIEAREADLLLFRRRMPEAIQVLVQVRAGPEIAMEIAMEPPHPTAPMRARMRAPGLLPRDWSPDCDLPA